MVKKQNCVIWIFTSYLDDIYKDIAENVEKRFDTSKFELECNSIEWPLPKGKK